MCRWHILGDQAQKEGPGRVRKGRRLKQSVVHPQPGTPEKHAECASHTTAKGWGRGGYTHRLPSPMVKGGYRGLNSFTLLGLWVSQVTEQQRQPAEKPRGERTDLRVAKGRCCRDPPALSQLSQKGPQCKGWNDGQQDTRRPVCAPVHSVSVYTTRTRERSDGCSLYLFLHLL